MHFKLFRRKTLEPIPLDRGQSLNLIPLKNREIREHRQENATLMLEYPVQYKPWAVRWVSRFGGNNRPTRFRKLQLDRLGSLVWDMIDGSRSVREIIARFTSEQQIERREAEVSVTLFFRELGRRGLIGFR